MKKEGIVINEKDHPEIYKWLSEYVHDYGDSLTKQQCFTLTSDNKINAYCNVNFYEGVTYFQHPFGYVEVFNCLGSQLNSLINSPEKVGEDFDCSHCEKLISFIGFPKIINSDIYLDYNKFSNNPKYKEEYKLYLAMWLELFESVSNKDRKEYINNYKDKVDYWENKHIIPVEILKEYGF